MGPTLLLQTTVLGVSWSWCHSVFCVKWLCVCLSEFDAFWGGGVELEVGGGHATPLSTLSTNPVCIMAFNSTTV